MKHLYVWLLTIACVLALVGAGVEAAPPGLPTVFYGTVRTGIGVPEGATVFAMVGDVELARATVRQEAMLGSVYVLDVPADDSDTPEIEGGRAGDAVSFGIELPNGMRYTMIQTGTWQGGTATQIDLTAKHVIRLPLIIRIGNDSYGRTSVRSQR